MQDYYYILGLQEGATANEIKQAYRKLATKFHPDKNNGDAYFADMFKQIQEAYDVLGDPAKRATYDAQRTRGHAPQHPPAGSAHHHATGAQQQASTTPAVVQSFTASNKKVRTGDTITLHWLTTHALKVEITGIGTVPGSGEMNYTVPAFKGEQMMLEIRAHHQSMQGYYAARIYLENQAVKDARHEKDRAKMREMLTPALTGLHPAVLKTGRDPKRADFGQRFVAFLIDGIIIAVLANLAASALASRMEYYPGLFAPLIMVLYGTLFECRGHYATPGKYFCHLKVSKPDGTNPNFGTALLRNVVKLFSGALLGVGFLMALWDKQNRALHDRAASTAVAEWGWDKMQRGEWPPEAAVGARSKK